MDQAMAELRAMLAERPPTAGSFQDRRARWEPLYNSICPVPPGTEAEPLAVPGLVGEWMRAAGIAPETERVVFYIHGGGFTAGTAPAYRGLAARFSTACDCPVLTVDYRLAPEEPFPAALEDCVASYRWLIGAGGADPRHLALVGDSAGGNLIIATMLEIRDAGEALPAVAVAVSPVFDLALTGDSVTERAARDPMILPSSLRACSAAYLGGADPRDPRASPLYAELHGLPPLLLQFGSEEMLRDDSARLGAKAATAGVDVTLREWPDMIHVWHLFAERLPDSRKAIAELGDFVRSHT